MTGPLIALSNLIIDHIVEADGRAHQPKMGGAGLYAAAGMRMWWPDVALVAGVGRNLVEFVTPEFESYGFDDRGLLVKDDHCIESRLVYREDGSRSESPTFGPQHFAHLQAGISDINSTLLPATGCYLFMDTNKHFWNQFAQRRSDFGLTMWEIDCAAALPERRDDFAAISPMIDVLSLNLAEGQALYPDLAEPSALLNELGKLGFAGVVLRMGADGAIAMHKGRQFKVRPPETKVVDVTGGGNSFSGGFLAGLCRHPDDPVNALKCAAAAAAKVIGQPGLPPLPDAGELRELASQVSVEIEQ